MLFGAIAPPLQEQATRSLDGIAANYGSRTALYLAADDPSNVFNATSGAVAKATGVSCLKVFVLPEVYFFALTMIALLSTRQDHSYAVLLVRKPLRLCSHLHPHLTTPLL